MKKFVLYTFVLIALLMTPFICFAKPIITNQGPLVDSNKMADLTILFKTVEEEALRGAEFSIYKIADISSYGVFTSIAPYEGYDFSYMEEEDWDRVAFDLSQYILDNAITTELTGKTDRNGYLSFNNIELGLYLVVGETHIEGANTYVPQVFLISLPNMLEQDQWEYEVEVNPKYTHDLDESKLSDKKVNVVWNDKGHEDLRPESVTVVLYKDGEEYAEVILNDENDWEHLWESLDDSYEWTVEIVQDFGDDYISSITRDGDTFIINITHKSLILPDTGMLWWPVPILFLVGLFLFWMGTVVHEKKDEEE